jgi:ubiquinone/menaquinone biosynthesis C-methylase UbiE
MESAFVLLKSKFGGHILAILYFVNYLKKGKEMNSPERAISRVNRSKEEAREAYDKMSPWYDLAGFAENPFKRAGLSLLNIKAGEAVLEIGYGTGTCLLPLVEAVGSSGKVYGLDLSAGMRQVAGKKIAKAGLSERVELVCGDAAALPYPDGFLDAVFISFTLELFDTPEIPLVLQQCWRVLKVGGRLGVVAMGKRGKEGWMSRIYAWSHDRFPVSVDCRPIYTRQSLEQTQFQITESKEGRMFGLPVDIVLARKG